ncbi:hypothetical protein HS125_06305 [bacterium]|nr:hypothetical protein [bacterium]
MVERARSGWTPDSPSALAERFLGDPAARKALEQMRDDHQERLAAMKTDHQAKVDKLKGQIQAARRENARLLGEIEKRSATP